MSKDNTPMNNWLRSGATGHRPTAERLARVVQGGQGARRGDADPPAPITSRQDEIFRAAKALGARVPEAIIGMVADAEDIGAAVASIKSAHPALFAPVVQGGADAGGGMGDGHRPSEPTDMNAWLRGRSGGEFSIGGDW